MKKALLLLSFVCLGTHISEARNPVVVLPDDTTREGQEKVGPEVLRNAQRAIDKNFTQPNFTAEQKQKILEKYSFLDPDHLIHPSLLAEALFFFEWNLEKIDNKKYLSVVDFSLNSTLARFFVIQIDSGKVWSLHVAHGEGSDVDNDGLAEQFSNIVDSHMSSLGFYFTAEVYNGLWGRSMRMDGLSDSNSKIRERAIVIHGADYVVDDDRVQPGRSWGCFSFSMAKKDELINRLQGGSVIFAGLGSKFK